MTSASSVVSLRRLSETLKTSRATPACSSTAAATCSPRRPTSSAAEKANLDCDLKILEQVIDETTRPVAWPSSTRCSRSDLGRSRGSTTAIDLEPDGPWIRVGNISNDVNPPAQYVPTADASARRRPIAACSSQLRAVTSVGSGDYTPRSAPPPAPGALPATGAAGAAAAGLALLAGWVLTRGVRRLRSAA